MGAVIAEREAQFRTLANTIPQLAWIADNDGSRTWFNDRWSDYTGRPLDEMLGFGWMDAHSPEVRSAGGLRRRGQLGRHGASAPP